MTGILKRNIRASGFAFFIMVLLCSVTVGRAFSQQVEMSSTLNPVGSGARAMGMGGAFISVADDATAASWNPAGLIHLERPEISVVGSYFSRSQTYRSDTHPEIEGTNTMDTSGLNYASAAYPFVFLKRNMIVSLNYQRLYEMNKKVSFNLTRNILDDKLNDTIRFTQGGYLYAVSPAYAVQVTPAFYLGATLNFWGDYLGKNGWDNTYLSTGTGKVFGHDLVERVDWRNSISFRGFNANLGLLWNISEKITLGGVYKTSFDGKLNRETTFASSQDWDAGTQHFESSTTTNEKLVMKMPASYGVGVSYRHSDKWHIALDLYRTDWSNFFIVDSKGNEINPLDGRLLSEGRLSDTTQVRFGTEYLFVRDNYAIPLRAGVFYDPEPARNKVDKFYGFSLGSGYSTTRFSLDVSYQYRWGNGTTGDIPSVEGSSADIRQHTVMMSAIIYF